MDDLPSIGRIQLGRASGSIGLGKYRIFASLGRGGMADVHLAAAQGPKGFNKLVVVKRLRPLLADDAAVVNMFLDEARLNARLNHPNLIHTYEFGEEHATYFIVMEFLEGQSLHDILHAVRLPGAPPKPVKPQVWAKIIAEALAGLHYAHELRDYDGTPLNVVHRDVSPQNIVVTYDGVVKLVDFGIAKASNNASKTESQIIKGKLAYMAPEQADPPDDGMLDRRADIFAMGIVLWECLAQRRLATGDARAVVSKIIDMEFQAPSLLNPEVPSELDAIARKALERSPGDRYQTAHAMREALERFLRAQKEMVDETTIGRLVSETFSHEHEDIQRQIRAQMSEQGGSRDLTVPDSTPSQRIARALFARDQPSMPRVGSSPSTNESVGSLRVVRTSVTAFETRGVRGKRLAMIGGTAFAALVLSLFALRRPVTTRTSPVSVAAASQTFDGAVSFPLVPPSAPSPSAAPVTASATTPATSDAGAAARATPAASATSSAAPAGKHPPAAPHAAPPSRTGPGQPKLDTDPWR